MKIRADGNLPTVTTNAEKNVAFYFYMKNREKFFRLCPMGRIWTVLDKSP